MIIFLYLIESKCTESEYETHEEEHFTWQSPSMNTEDFMRGNRISSRYFVFDGSKKQLLIVGVLNVCGHFGSILYLIYASFLYCFLFVVCVSVCITVFCVWLYLSQCLCAHTTVTTASKTQHVSSLFRALPLFPSLSLALKQLSF